MLEMVYNTWARSDNHWARQLLDGWRASGKPFMSFPWVSYQLHTLPTSVFWLYLFYSAARTDWVELQGKIEFRLQIVAWRGHNPYSGEDVYSARPGEQATAWFMIDRFEELRRADGSLLALQDFKHLYGQNILTVMRTSIPNVTLVSPVQVIQRYP
jgi:hypothetical protein